MDSELRSTSPTETKIEGNWILENGKLIADVSTKRIDYLIKNELIELGRSTDGWSVLYRSKEDKRYWELSYADSSLHGGGAPVLTVLSDAAALARYNISNE